MADDVLPWTKEEQDQEDDVGKQTKDDEQDSVPLRSPPEPSQIEPYTPEEKEGGIDEAASVESPVIPSLPVQTALHISGTHQKRVGSFLTSEPFFPLKRMLNLRSEIGMPVALQSSA